MKTVIVSLLLQQQDPRLSRLDLSMVVLREFHCPFSPLGMAACGVT